jgi:hypothetical protein
LQHLESKEFATLDAFILLTCFFVCNWYVKSELGGKTITQSALIL